MPNPTACIFSFEAPFDGASLFIFCLLPRIHFNFQGWEIGTLTVSIQQTSVVDRSVVGRLMTSIGRTETSMSSPVRPGGADACQGNHEDSNNRHTIWPLIKEGFPDYGREHNLKVRKRGDHSQI